MKILFATDGSPCSEAATETIAGRPWPKGSELKIISVVEPPPPISPESFTLSNDFYRSWEESGNNQAQTAIEKALARFRAGDATQLTISTAVIHGGARETILEEAEKWGADLIVLGSHGYRGLTKFLLGSVSQAVASHAKCSVEIVRCKEAIPL